MFPKSAPVEGSGDLKAIQREDPHIAAGEGRTLGYQALMQLFGKYFLQTDIDINLSN